jgi:hypothetical protein
VNSLTRSIAHPAVAIAMAFFAAGSAHASSSVQATSLGAVDAKACADRIAPTGLDARIIEKAAQGVDALRQYLWTTRGIYGLDMADTVAWLDRQRAVQANCGAAHTTGR